MKKYCTGAFSLLLLIIAIFPLVVDAADSNGFSNLKAVRNKLTAFTGDDNIHLHTLAATAGNKQIVMLEISNGKEPKPAVLIVGNMTGKSPAGTDAVIYLTEYLHSEKPDILAKYNWYIVPLGNPDGYSRFFSSPLQFDSRNAKPWNDDMDDRVDEDGSEDLNKDGYITVMRQKHPEGSYIEDELFPGIMRKADSKLGEQGIFRIITEGIDNDRDGKYNEDPAGGVNPGHNFPHRFEHYTDTDGLWAGSETESRAIMEFAFDHSEIALILIFDRSNTLLNIPAGNKKEESQGNKFKIPKRYAKQLGVSPDTEFPLKEIAQMFRELWSWPALTEDRVKRFLGGGAMVNPDKNDLAWWKVLQSKYKEFLKSQEISTDRIDPPSPPPGSIEEWAYYQYGVPVFSFDFWTVPKIEIADSLKPAEEPLIDEDDLFLFRYAQNSFLKWEKFNHPDLGEVEIGGKIPYCDIVPAYDTLQVILQKEIPFIGEIISALPEITIDTVSVIETAPGIWKVEAWIKNDGIIPYPTYQGKRSKQQAPLAVKLNGKSVEFIEGKPRETISIIDGSGGVEKVKWLVKAGKGEKLELEVSAPALGKISSTINLTGGK